MAEIFIQYISGFVSPSTQKCDEIIVLHLGYLNYTQYQIMVSFKGLENITYDIKVNFSVSNFHTLAGEGYNLSELAEVIWDGCHSTSALGRPYRLHKLIF